MKIKLFNFTLAVIMFSLTFTASLKTEEVTNYSLLVDKSNSEAMFILRFSSIEQKGLIFSYGGYQWFEKVYEKKSGREKTFIQPSRYGDGSNKDSWTMPRFVVNDFNFVYRDLGEDSIIAFSSAQAMNRIEGYIARDETFSLATVQPGKSWYANTWKPINNINQLISVANNNPKIFCKIISEKYFKESLNRELIKPLNLLGKRGYTCDQNQNLNIVSSGIEKKRNVKTEKKTDKDFKDYWWVLIILVLGAFFLYTTTVKKPLRKFKKIKKSKKIQSKIAKYWAGHETLVFSFWIICFLFLGALAIPLILIEKAADNMSGFFILISFLYIIFFFVAAIIAYVGCWRSAGFYIKMKLKKKGSAFWGYATYVYLSLSVLRSVVEIFQEF